MKLNRDGGFQFDCQVRNAPTRVQPMLGGDRACWTGCDATVARSAAIRDGPIRRQFKRGQNSREKKPSPEPLINKDGAFAMPANASLCGMIHFHHRPRVAIAFPLSTYAEQRITDPVRLSLSYA